MVCPGKDFGPGAPTVVNTVYLHGQPCLRSLWVSQEELICTVAAGYGTDMVVGVSLHHVPSGTNVDATPGPHLFSFEPPVNGRLAGVSAQGRMQDYMAR